MSPLNEQTKAQLLALREVLGQQLFMETQGSTDEERGQRIGWNTAMRAVRRQIDEVLASGVVTLEFRG